MVVPPAVASRDADILFEEAGLFKIHACQNPYVQHACEAGPERSGRRDRPRDDRNTARPPASRIHQCF